MRLRKNIAGLQAVFFALALTAGITSCKQETRRERLAREAREFTDTHCPQHLDPVTTLDSMIFRNEEVPSVEFYHSLNINDEESDIIASMKNEFREKVLQDVRNTIQMREYKEEKANFIYVYTNAVSGKKLFTVKITPEEYERAKK